MISEKHTLEPWSYDQQSKSIANDTILQVVAWTVNYDSKADVNAKRIVECVNAMEGIEDPELFRTTAEDRHVKAEKRKEALEAVKSYLGKTGITIDNADLWSLVNEALK